MFKKSKVLFKGKGSGLIISLDEDSAYEDIKAELLTKVKNSRNFFKGASEDIIFEGKRLTSQQENEIVDIIINKAGLEVGFINTEPEMLVKKTVPAPPPKTAEENLQETIERLFYKDTSEKVLIYQGFVRSGKLIEAEENVVIIGGVNPGGEIFAGKSIVVFGQLKGRAVAGRNGAADSFIAAILMEPELLGIHSYVTRFPEEKKDKLSKAPSIARLEGGKIVITPAGNTGPHKP